MSNLYFITGNKGKFDEIKQIIPFVIQQNIDLPEIQELDIQKIITQKLNYASKLVTGNIIVEDGYFNLVGLNNFPGPLIKWFSKSISNKEIYNICNLLNNYEVEVGITIGLKTSNETNFFTGSQTGKIVLPVGDNGFGWDPIFQPNGYTKTYAQMTLEEKNDISMRKIAAEKLKEYLYSHDQAN